MNRNSLTIDPIVIHRYLAKSEKEVKKNYFLTPFEVFVFQDRNPVFRMIDVTDLRYTGA
jgi:hypothetical protein